MLEQLLAKLCEYYWNFLIPHVQSHISHYSTSLPTYYSPGCNNRNNNKTLKQQLVAMHMQSPFLNTLQSRGFIADCTDFDHLDKLLTSQQNPVPAYIGFDCTAPSLHVGSLMQIMTLRWFQKSGHKPIILVGGGTTKVGDPSGKDESRKLLTDELIHKNKNAIKSIFGQFITFEGEFTPSSTNAFLVDNADWLNDINYIDFLRDYGRHFSVNRMLGMESVKLRLEREHHLSFLEFNYMILQAYDFTKLNEVHGCRLQIGGSDQWGNIVNGIELQRRLNASTETRGDELFGLTTPLLTTASGTKMGKTEQGAVWLNKEMLSTYDYWQFWRNTEDADVGKFLRLFTELPLEEILRLESLEGAEINQAKITLANEVTALTHSREDATAAEETARKVFEQGGVGDNLPIVEISRSLLETGIPAFALFKEAGMEPSGGAARRLITGGGAKINDEKVNNAEQAISLENITDEGHIKLSAGKKRHVLVITV